MPRVVARNRKKNALATRLGAPRLVAGTWVRITGAMASEVAAQPFNLGIVAGISPADVDPGEDPAGDDHQRAKQDAEGESGHDELAQQRLLPRDQPEEPEVDQHHRGGEQQGETAPGPREGPELGFVLGGHSGLAEEVLLESVAGAGLGPDPAGQQ